MSEHYRKEALPPLEPLTIKKPNGDKIIVNAIGYGMVKPCIDFVQHSTTAGGRARMESIAFAGENFDKLYEFLTRAKKHWEQP